MLQQTAPHPISDGALRRPMKGFPRGELIPGGLLLSGGYGIMKMLEKAKNKNRLIAWKKGFRSAPQGVVCEAPSSFLYRRSPSGKYLKCEVLYHGFFGFPSC
ncbi:MAG: hypothetical protein SOX25_00050 [Eubacteriales bacterium]|nr:hypothetical protein [Eubacteriales bacterium]